MTQKDKELLLKDLCARLPYGVKVQHQHQNYLEEVQTVEHISRKYGEIETNSVSGFADDFKPYLKPLYSMTEEEKEDLLITLLGKNGTKYFQVLPDGSIDNNDAAHQDLSNFNIHWINFDGVNTSTYIDWLNAHHFDYRGLIEKGLAIDCTGLNIYT